MGYYFERRGSPQLANTWYSIYLLDDEAKEPLPCMSSIGWTNRWHPVGHAYYYTAFVLLNGFNTVKVNKVEAKIRLRLANMFDVPAAFSLLASYYNASDPVFRNLMRQAEKHHDIYRWTMVTNFTDSTMEFEALNNCDIRAMQLLDQCPSSLYRGQYTETLLSLGDASTELRQACRWYESGESVDKALNQAIKSANQGYHDAMGWIIRIAHDGVPKRYSIMNEWINKMDNHVDACYDSQSLKSTYALLHERGLEPVYESWLAKSSSIDDCKAIDTSRTLSVPKHPATKPRGAISPAIINRCQCGVCWFCQQCIKNTRKHHLIKHK